MLLEYWRICHFSPLVLEKNHWMYLGWDLVLCGSNEIPPMEKDLKVEPTRCVEIGIFLTLVQGVRGWLVPYKKQNKKESLRCEVQVYLYLKGEENNECIAKMVIANVCSHLFCARPVLCCFMCIVLEYSSSTFMKSAFSSPLFHRTRNRGPGS